ncbi:MAG: DUF3617 family protein [Pseudomonadota bacterium]
MKRSFIACMFAVSAASTALAQDVTLEITPGMWENTANIAVEMDMGGQTMSIPAQVKTDQECVTEEDATLDLSDLTEDGCTVTDLKQTGNSVTAVLSCSSQGMTMDGEMTTNVSGDGNSATTSIDATGTSPMGNVAMSGTVTGKRIGDC